MTKRISTRVGKKENIADGVVELTLDAVAGQLPVWEPGAHLSLHLADGLIRQYSLCGSPDGDTYRLAILREPNSRGGSAFVHDFLAVDGVIEVDPPRNHFALVDAPEYIFFAGGIGITPLLPMIERTERVGRPWRLEYGGRTRLAMAYVAELLDKYPGRVRIHPQDEVGLIPLAEVLSDRSPQVAVYCCGPAPLIDAVGATCAEYGLENFRCERFTGDGPVTLSTDREFEVVLATSDRTVRVPVGTTIMEAVEAAGVPVEFSCREGICGTCETAVLEGLPDHRDQILTDAERSANDTIFICVSRSCGPRLTLDL
ncbi:PDR/VanB family oxidoreductase [Rhodococcus koreensis]